MQVSMSNLRNQISIKVKKIKLCENHFPSPSLTMNGFFMYNESHYKPPATQQHDERSIEGLSMLATLEEKHMCDDRYPSFFL